MNWEDKSMENLVLRTSGAYFQESQRAIGNKTPLINDPHKVSHTLRARAEAVI